ncbi:MAG TPA: AAA family ATPase [Woeseiaceae bacterium]|nr:AAA family ATPase [Woeseiaceae bacterium]
MAESKHRGAVVIFFASMLITPNRRDLNTIVVLNPKGGCGKTTLVTNLASLYAARGPLPAVMDCDPQGSTMRWIEKRSNDAPPIHGIAVYKNNMQATRSWQLRVPTGSKTLIVDSPAGLNHDALRSLTRDASSIIVPVLPSSIDIHAASRCIADLLLVAKIDRRDRKLAVVANRTRQNTRSFEKLMRFLDSLEIPIVGVLRDSQSFVHAVESGIGVSEMPRHRAQREIDEMEKIVSWLDGWQERRRLGVTSEHRRPTLTLVGS